MNRKILITLFLLLTIVLILIFSAIYFKSIIELKIDEAKINLNPNKKVEIVFITDKNYVNYLKVAIKSAIVNKNMDSIYNISILGVDLDKDDIAQIVKLNEDSIKINVIPLSLDLIKNIQFNPYKYSSANEANLFKFLIPDILKDIDKVLYIDSDTIILKDLLKLYNTNLSDRYLGAVVYSGFQFKKQIKIIGNIYLHAYKEEAFLYSGGVMLLNLKKMRKDRISKKLIDFKNSKEGEVGVTDYTFNKVIPFCMIKSLPPIYNLEYYNNYNLENYNYYWGKNIKSSDEFIKQAEILHLKDKPWKNKTAPFADLWWKYAEMAGIDE